MKKFLPKQLNHVGMDMETRSLLKELNHVDMGMVTRSLDLPNDQQTVPETQIDLRIGLQ
jgi:hypothetical protein